VILKVSWDDPSAHNTIQKAYKKHLAYPNSQILFTLIFSGLHETFALRGGASTLCLIDRFGGRCRRYLSLSDTVTPLVL
jgi:hypothetical protein